MRRKLLCGQNSFYGLTFWFMEVQQCTMYFEFNFMSSLIHLPTGGLFLWVLTSAGSIDLGAQMFSLALFIIDIALYC